MKRFNEKMFGTERTWGEFYEALSEHTAQGIVLGFVFAGCFYVSIHMLANLIVEEAPKVCHIIKESAIDAAPTADFSSPVSK